jgi:hypothetical protein
MSDGVSLSIGLVTGNGAISYEKWGGVANRVGQTASKKLIKITTIPNQRRKNPREKHRLPLLFLNPSFELVPLPR